MHVLPTLLHQDWNKVYMIGQGDNRSGWNLKGIRLKQRNLRRVRAADNVRFVPPDEENVTSELTFRRINKSSLKILWPTMKRFLSQEIPLAERNPKAGDKVVTDSDKNHSVL
jgi:hypothetical protein